MAPNIPTIHAPELDHLARRVVTSAVAPTCACATCFRVAGTWHLAVGAAATQVEGPEIVPDSLVFDLASVTKPFFAMAVHEAISRGELIGSMQLEQMLPQTNGTFAASATLEALLSHRSGLAAHRELFQAMRARTPKTVFELLKVAANAAGSSAIRTGAAPALYSDLGYMLAGAAVAAQLRCALDEWVVSSSIIRTIGGIGSARAWLKGTHRTKYRFVPTEVVPWRGGLIAGVVHDENAWLLAGHGMAGHAGLFGTAGAVATFGARVLDALAGRLGREAQVAAIRATVRRDDATLCSGFDRCTAVGSSAGSFCSRNSFGHLGFTGTSLWCDPDRETVAVVLANRVCPSRENQRIKSARPELHDSLFRWAETQKTQPAG